MIFISHTHKDKPVVESIANKLKEVFGQENIFYDSCSIQPGDGIINKMNEGLLQTKHFIFFVSKNSLQSSMVSLEWQNSLMKTANNTDIKFIPVKMDDCIMPEILLQTSYIDMFGKGFEFGVLQLVDVLQGNNTYKGGLQEFENLRAEVIQHNSNKVDIKINAIAYAEPVSRYIILMSNTEGEINFQATYDGMVSTNYFPQISGEFNGFYFGVERATTPSLPFTIELTSNVSIHIISVLHQKNTEIASPMPFTIIKGVEN